MKTLVIHKKPASDFDIDDCFESDQEPLPEEENEEDEKKNKLDQLLNGLNEDSDASDPFDIVNSDDDEFLAEDDEVPKGASWFMI